MIPKIKKKLTSFLTEEEGKISKQSLLSLGSFLSAAVIGGILATKDVAAATHSNSLSVSYSGDLGSGSHAHHSSHANHANHSSGTTSTTSGTTGGGDGGPTTATTSTTSTTSGGFGCFTSDQKVLTPSGLVDIDNLKPDLKVVSYDESSDKFSLSTIGEVIVHDGKKNCMNDFQENPLIELLTNIKGKLTKTKVTENHYYYDPSTKEYRPLRLFNEGDKIRGRDGVGTIIQKKIIGKVSNSDKVVYNLHMVEGPSNYLVNGIVVHNIK